jgi:hypothetical protein
MYLYKYKITCGSCMIGLWHMLLFMCSCWTSGRSGHWSKVDRLRWAHSMAVMSTGPQSSRLFFCGGIWNIWLCHFIPWCSRAAAVCVEYLWINWREGRQGFLNMYSNSWGTMPSFMGMWAAAHQAINTVICWDCFRYVSQAVVLKCCKIQKDHCSKM